MHNMPSEHPISHNFPSQETFHQLNPLKSQPIVPAEDVEGYSTFKFIDSDTVLPPGSDSSIHVDDSRREYENTAALLKNYRSVDEVDSTSISRPLQTHPHSIQHSKSFGPDNQNWNSPTLTPSQTGSKIDEIYPYYQDSSYINRSSSHEVVPSQPPFRSKGRGDLLARSHPGPVLSEVSATPPPKSVGSSLDKSSSSLSAPTFSTEIMFLSDEILCRIFSYCSWRELLCVLSLVCKRWTIIIENDPYLCKFQNVSIDISSSTLDYQRMFVTKRSCLRQVTLRFKNDFEYASTYKLVLEDFLTLLGKQCRYLEGLIIKEYDWKQMSQPIPWIRSELFQNLSRLHLENISFRHCNESSFQSISALGHLELLVLIEESKLSDKEENSQSGGHSYKLFFEALEVLIRELTNLKEITVMANTDDVVTEAVLKNFVRNVIESNNPVEKMALNNMDKWVLTLTGCEMMQMITNLKHLTVHTLSSKTDARVMQNLLNLFNRIKSLEISIEDSLSYDARLNLEHQTFPNIESLKITACGSTISLVKCFPKVKHLKCLAKLTRVTSSTNQDSRIILKQIHKALTQFNVAFFADLETVSISRTYLLLYRYCERVHPRYMSKLRQMLFINDDIYFVFTAFSAHLRLPDGPELLSALRRRFSNTFFAIRNIEDL